MVNLKRVTHNIIKDTRLNLVDIFNVLAVPEIKDVIYDDYNRLLVNVVLDKRSKSRPEDYLSDFMDAIDEFEFVKVGPTDVTLRTPDMDNFKFKGRLKVLKQILEGTVGVYYEISEEDYIKLTGKKKIDIDPVDSYMPQSERFYLIKQSNPLLKKSKDIFKRLVKYPFSNSQPIDLFGGVNNYVNENIDKWIGLSIKELKNNHG